MLKELRIDGFKAFKGSSVHFKNLKPINVLVGINGCGKSSVLEAISGMSQLLSQGSGDIVVSTALNERLHSLYHPSAKFEIRSTTVPSETCEITISTPKAGNSQWSATIEGNYDGEINVLGILDNQFTPFNVGGGSGNPRENIFLNIPIFEKSRIEPRDYFAANDFLGSLNSSQRSIGDNDTSRGTFYFENGNEIKLDFLAGGTRKIAELGAAFRNMLERGRNVLLIDDFGDEIFPALREKMVPRLIELYQLLPASQSAQIFLTTHNVEVVKSALDNSSFCNVYMLDYSGKLVNFDNEGIILSQESSGIDSNKSIAVIGRMLGLKDTHLGFPELVILSEEESKRTFLKNIALRSQFKPFIKDFEVQIPFQAGDGNVTKAINNLLDLSKFFSYSDIWSDRYAIFTDCNPIDYNQENGLVKEGESQHLKALKKVQEILGLNNRFILTKQDGNYVGSLEETYPTHLKESFKAENTIETDTEEWIRRSSDKGEAKNKLAKYMADNLTVEEFEVLYPSLWNLLKKQIS